MEAKAPGLAGASGAATGGRGPTQARRALALARAARDKARTADLLDEEDQKAMRAFREGDSGAFTHIVRRHEKGLFNFCLRMLGSRNAAEDAAQEVLLKVVRSADRWTPKAKVRTWMYAIARNHCIDEVRKAKHRQTDSLDRPLKAGEGGATVLDRVADDAGITPDRGADSARLRAPLVRALESLSEEQREVFVMREQVGLPFKEIAEIVGVPENTAKSRMRYALEALRAALAQEGITAKELKP